MGSCRWLLPGVRTGSNFQEYTVNIAYPKRLGNFQRVRVGPSCPSGHRCCPGPLASHPRRCRHALHSAIPRQWVCRVLRVMWENAILEWYNGKCMQCVMMCTQNSGSIFYWGILRSTNAVKCGTSTNPHNLHVSCHCQPSSTLKNSFLRLPPGRPGRPGRQTKRSTVSHFHTVKFGVCSAPPTRGTGPEVRDHGGSQSTAPDCHGTL